MELSKKYMEWVKETGQSGLTRTQATFAEWLLKNEDKINQIGDLETIFISVQRFLKSKNNKNASATNP